jgi:uncharacterized protein YwgA
MQKRLDLLNNRLIRLEKEHEDSLQENERLTSEINKMQKEVDRLQEKLAEKDALIASLQGDEEKKDVVQVLKNRGMITDEDIESTKKYIVHTGTIKSFEDVLVIRGIISTEQLEKARSIAQAHT